MVDYGPFWATIKKKGISQYDLINMGVERRLLDRLRHNRNITVLTLENLCRILDCTPNDVIAFRENEK